MKMVTTMMTMTMAVMAISIAIAMVLMTTAETRIQRGRR